MVRERGEAHEFMRTALKYGVMGPLYSAYKLVKSPTKAALLKVLIYDYGETMKLQLHAKSSFLHVM